MLKMLLIEDIVLKKHESADEIKVIHKKIDYNNSTIAFVTVLMKRYMFPVIVVLTSGFQFSLNLTLNTFIFSWRRNTKPYQG